jgi:hypothetical protein
VGVATQIVQEAGPIQHQSCGLTKWTDYELVAIVGRAQASLRKIDVQWFAKASYICISDELKREVTAVTAFGSYRSPKMC